MKHARVEQILLVNWKGVFFRAYSLGEQVTTLEGKNGAGKTTVLMAAVVALLPDLRKLRFSNIGAGAAGSDKGLWGRLANAGPAYSALDVRLPTGERVVAGVQLVRRAEPSVEATTFLVRGLHETVSLDELFLERVADKDRIPDLATIQHQVTRAGGEFKETTLKDYFAELFDLGVTSLRLSTDDDRSRFSDLLQTSMAGGISKSLTSDLRTFLLREENTLATSVKKMRENLTACRNTRVEVQEARALEGEISSIFEAGEAMFAAALHATKQRAAEAERKYRASHDAVLDLEAEESIVSAQQSTCADAVLAIEKRITTLDAEEREAVSLVERLTKADAVQQRLNLASIEEARSAEIEAERAAGAAQSAKRVADAEREQTAAQDELGAASAALADFQEGLDDLHRRASDFRSASSRLAEAQRLLPEEPVTATDIVQVRASVDVRVEDVHRSLANSKRQLGTADAAAREHAAAASALSALLADASMQQDLHAQAVSVLLRQRELDALVGRRPSLLAETRRLRERVAERARTVEEATALLGDAPTGAGLVDAHAAATRDYERLNEELEDLETRATSAAGTFRDAQTRLFDLDERVGRWRQLGSLLRGLSPWVDVTAIRTRDDVSTLGVRLTALRDASRTLRDQLEAKLGGERAERTRFSNGYGSHPAGLLDVKDAVDGTLVVDQFDDIDVESAPMTEALLGARVNAILVDNPRRAAEAATRVETAPSNLLFLPKEAVANRVATPGGELRDDFVIVDEADATRVTRIPTSSVVGRRAREARAKELDSIIAATESELHACERQGAELTHAVTRAASLVEFVDVLGEDDLEARLESQRKARDAAEGAERAARLSAEGARVTTEQASARLKKLVALLPKQSILDESDLPEKLRRAEDALRDATEAVASASSRATHRAVLEKSIEALRSPPLSVADRERLAAAILALTNESDRLLRALAALDDVLQKPEALTWGSSIALLEQRTAIAPQFHARHAAAKVRKGTADGAVTEARQVDKAASASLSDAQADLKTIRATIERDEAELASLGGAPEEDALPAAQRALDLRREMLQEKNRERDTLVEKRGELNGKLAGVQENLTKARAAMETDRRAWQPEQDRFDQLAQRSAAAGVLQNALLPRYDDLFGKTGSANARTRAQEHATALRERLRRAKDAAEIAGEVDSAVPEGQELSGEACLRAWLAVRQWLLRRIPSQFADVDEPLEALTRLKAELTALEVKLKRHENLLRVEADGVARNIDISIRRAHRHVDKLNVLLKGTAFGNVQEIQLSLGRVETMESALKALRGEEGRTALSQDGVPIEAALEELFRRHGGKLGADRILDYRYYLDPRVEIRRTNATMWEAVDPSRVSTGEGIGVGAALMMVVLTEWERAANVFRNKRGFEPLRFLLLDEANRLDRESLAEIFDLCRSLNLQLLLAAPEVAQAKGNIAYHLARRYDEAGNPTVVVSGRRLRAS